MIYLDHNATTPLAPEVLEAMMPYLTELWYNPSSSHSGAKRVRAAMEQARSQVAGLLGAEPDELVFSSGATESTNTVLRTAAGQGLGILTTEAEHSATYECLKALEKQDVKLAWVGVDQEGRVDLEALEARLASGDFALFTYLWANNETGVVQEAGAISRLCRQYGVAIHVDAVQALGKMPLDALDYDYLSVSAHKFNGPKGIGALVVRSGRPLAPLIIGGGQEAKRRGGTENPAAIVGMGKACERLAQVAPEKTFELRQLFEKGLLDQVPDAVINGSGAQRLNNTVSVTLPGCQAEGLLILLEEGGVIASTGSACSTGKLEPSRVLTAMGLSRTQAKSTLRFSLGPDTTQEEIDQALAVLSRAVSKLRSVQSKIAGPVVVYQPKRS